MFCRLCSWTELDFSGSADRTGEDNRGCVSAQQQVIGAGGDNPLPAGDVVVGEGAGIEGEGHPLRLASREGDLGKSLELLGRPADRRVLGSHIELHHGGAGAGAGIADVEVDAHRAVGCEGAVVHREPVEGKARVAEAETEREERLDAVVIVVAVADEHPFAIFDFAIDPRVDLGILA